jgi:hypothetical protein
MVNGSLGRVASWPGIGEGNRAMSTPEHRRALLAIFGGIVCLAMAGPVSAAGNTFDGVYAGKRSLTNGPTSSQCPTEDPVSVTISQKTLTATFTNSGLKDFVIGIGPQPDGSFDVTYEDVGGTTVFIKGRITDASIGADITNYSTTCTYHWHLTKQQ